MNQVEIKCEKLKGGFQVVQHKSVCQGITSTNPDDTIAICCLGSLWVGGMTLSLSVTVTVLSSKYVHLPSDAADGGWIHMHS